MRWRRSDRTRPEDYFARFKVVATDAELAIDVIYAEFLAREQEGDRPDLAEFQSAFPVMSTLFPNKSSCTGCST